MAKFIEVIDTDVEGIERRVRYPWNVTSQEIEDGFTVQTVYSASVTLTNDQIKALPTTPITVVEAVEGKIFQLVAATGVLDNTAGAYASTGDAFCQLWITGASGSVKLDWDDALTDDTEPWVTALGPDTTLHYLSQFVGSGIQVTAINSSNPMPNQMVNYTGGHADNTFKVTVLYALIDE